MIHNTNAKNFLFSVFVVLKYVDSNFSDSSYYVFSEMIRVLW